MSKSLGTGVDPLELIETYGADPTRFGLLNMASTQDVRFADERSDEPFLQQDIQRRPVR
jgi:valyl-tRNA synthetase